MSKCVQNKYVWIKNDSERKYTWRQINWAKPCWRFCLRTFLEWLEVSRNLSLSSITVRIRSTRSFLEILPVAGCKNLCNLTAMDIEDSFILSSKRLKHSALRSMQAAMRLFLTLSFERKWTPIDLSFAVPKIHTIKLDKVPRGVDDDTIHWLLSQPTNNKRNHVILQMLCTYGVRRSQICQLKLRDIDWRSRTITFEPQKGGKVVVHSLTAQIANKLSIYLQEERCRKTKSAHVFLRLNRPYVPMNPESVSSMVRDLLDQREGYRGAKGPHALRHSFATRVLQQGHSIKVISDLLGHRTLDSTQVYAKVDQPSLRSIADEWPGELS